MDSDRHPTRPLDGVAAEASEAAAGTSPGDREDGSGGLPADADERDEQARALVESIQDLEVDPPAPAR